MPRISCPVGPVVRIAATLAILVFVAGTAIAGGEATGYAALVRRVAPSVVTILVVDEPVGAADRAAERAARRAAADADPTAVNEILRRLLAAPGDPGSRGEGISGSLGSGFVIRKDGLIVTNRHVIVGARSVKVHLSDGREFAARIIGADAVTDIALLGIAAGDLVPLHLGSSAQVSVGDAVIAIGNPYGLGQSVSAGIISARARTLEDDPYVDFLQTDASINRGNSGGPLLTADGTVVGVTSAIFSPSGGSVGLGFAIPAETVAAIVGQLEAHQRVERGYLGITAQDLTPALATALQMTAPAGALVTGVDAAGPASGTLAIGDVLLDVGTEPVTFRDLSKIMARLVPGSLATLKILRDHAPQSVALKIGELPDPPGPVVASGQDTWVPALGMGVAATTAENRRAIKASDEPGGLIITQLRPNAPGALAGLRVGDLVTHLGTNRLLQTAELAGVDAPSAAHPVLIRVVRDGAGTFVAITGEIPP
jgi:serine protease Do